MLHTLYTAHTHSTNTHPFNGPLSGTTQGSRYQKGKTNLYFSEARDSEWQFHQLDHMQVCTFLQTDNHTSTPPLSFFTGWTASGLCFDAVSWATRRASSVCPSWCPTNSVKALEAYFIHSNIIVMETSSSGISEIHYSVLFCSLAVLDPRVGHTMDVLSPFIPVLCHSD